MSYQLDFWQTLEVMLIGDNFFWTIAHIFINIILPIIAYSAYRGRIYRTMIIGAVILIWGVNFPIFGSGWQIHEDKILIKDYSYSSNIDISKMNITIVNPKSEWWPLSRNIGAEYPKLSIGDYDMRNGKHALLFNHYNQKRLLLISSGNEYYLIGNPNIELLYVELIRLGAKIIEVK